MKNVTFYVGSSHGDDHLDYSRILNDEEFFSENRPSADHWQTVRVANEDDKKAWISAMHDQCAAAWEPNQSPDERLRSKAIIAESQAIMDRLEI